MSYAAYDLGLAQHIFPYGYYARLAPSDFGVATEIKIKGFPPDTKDREIKNLLEFLPGFQMVCRFHRERVHSIDG